MFTHVYINKQFDIDRNINPLPGVEYETSMRIDKNLKRPHAF